MKRCIFCMTPLETDSAFCPHCGRSSEYDCPIDHLPPGTLLNHGKYLLGAAIGAGGFGITYIGLETTLNMRVAIKEFYPRGYVSRSSTIANSITTAMNRQQFLEDGKKRFLDEARNLASLSADPGIVNVREFFEENNTAYIVMEYLDGKTLKDYLRERGTIPYKEVFSLLLPAMRSLETVHENGLIHRDISPDNIMIVKGGVKLLDFGAAREYFDDEDEKTLSVMLKRGYAPVEQYSKKGQGAWTDIYALCATMYKCITGNTPIEPFMRRTEELELPSAMGIQIDARFEQVLMKGLEIYPEKRYRKVKALIDAFQSALSEERTVSEEILKPPFLVEIPEFGEATVFGETDKETEWQKREREAEDSHYSDQNVSIQEEPVIEKIDNTALTGHKKKFLFFGIAAAILVFLIILGVVFLNNHSTVETPTQTTVETPTQTTECSHELDSGRVRTEATCVQQGLKVYTCTLCGEVVKKEKIPVDKDNHKTTVRVDEEPADVGTDGYTAGKYCLDCGKYVSGHEVIPALTTTTTTEPTTSPTTTTRSTTTTTTTTTTSEATGPAETFWE